MNSQSLRSMRANNAIIQCWGVFKIQVFKILLKMLYIYLVFSILNTFVILILVKVFKIPFSTYLVFHIFKSQNTFSKYFSIC